MGGTITDVKCSTMSPFASLKLSEMLMQKMNATKTVFVVGYLSASQFSREYHRFFGRAPTKDIARFC